MTSEKPKGGLQDVVAGRTAISYLDPSVDRLYYRGYDIEALAAQSTFEETAYLLLRGELPRPGELNAFSRDLRNGGRLSPALAKTLAGLPRRAHPMDFLRSAVSILGALTPPKAEAPDTLLRQSVSLISLTPTLVARSAGRPAPKKQAWPRGSHAARM